MLKRSLLALTLVFASSQSVLGSVFNTSSLSFAGMRATAQRTLNTVVNKTVESAQKIADLAKPVIVSAGTRTMAIAKNTACNAANLVKNINYAAIGAKIAQNAGLLIKFVKEKPYISAASFTTSIALGHGFMQYLKANQRKAAAARATQEKNSKYIFSRN